MTRNHDFKINVLTYPVGSHYFSVKNFSITCILLSENSDFAFSNMEHFDLYGKTSNETLELLLTNEQINVCA